MGVGIGGDDVAQLPLGDVAAEGAVAHVDDFAVAKCVVGDAAGGVVADAEVVEHHGVYVDSVVGVETAVDGVGARHVPGAVEVDMAVAEGVEHGGAEGEEAVGVHAVTHLGAQGVVDLLPVDVFDIEHGVSLVHLLPQVVEDLGGAGGRAVGDKGFLARGGQKENSQGCKQGMQFHGFGELRFEN